MLLKSKRTIKYAVMHWKNSIKLPNCPKICIQPTCVVLYNVQQYIYAQKNNPNYTYDVNIEFIV